MEETTQIEKLRSKAVEEGTLLKSRVCIFWMFELSGAMLYTSLKRLECLNTIKIY